jgi:hypothetical protein
MKYPEYDSPFELVVSDITTQLAQQIDKECWQAIQRVGINVDKEKMLTALKHDAERYREAYAKGHETGYTERDEEIIRCKDCKWKGTYACFCKAKDDVQDDWFCSEGELKEGR